MNAVMETSTITKKKGTSVFFPNLDALRFFACIVVLNRHTLHFIFKDYFKEDHGIVSYLFGFITNGGMGVSFFFVLSGFLITYLILDELRRTDKFSVPNFYMRRALRIWPLFYAVLLIGFVIIPFISKHIGSAIQVNYSPLHYIAFLSNFDYLRCLKLNPGDDYTVLNITWSVSIEEQFYIVYALFVFILPRKFLPYYLALVVGISTFFRYLHHDDSITLYFHSFSVMSDLAIGGLGAYLSYHSDAFRKFVSGLSKWLILVVYVIGFTYCIFYHALDTIPYWGVVHRLITGLFFAFIILEQNFADSSLFKLGNYKRITHWGKITYGLYLLHPAIFFVTGRMHDWWLPKNNIILELIWWIFSYVIVFTVCEVSFKYFETPFLKLRHKFAR